MVITRRSRAVTMRLALISKRLISVMKRKISVMKRKKLMEKVDYFLLATIGGIELTGG
jgi:hypothetical protein